MSWIARTYRTEVTVAAGATSGTATLPYSVNTASSFAAYGGFRVNDTTYTAAEDQCRVDLQNSTTIRVRTNTANASVARVVPVEVVECNSGVTSVQQVDIAFGTGDSSQTATINSVTTSRAAYLHLGQITAQPNNDWNYTCLRGTLTSSTVVTQNRTATGATATGAGVVIEWASALINNIQVVSATIAASTSLTDTAVTAVSDGQAMLFYGGWNMATFAANQYNRVAAAYRTSTTNVRSARGTSGSTSTAIVNSTLIEFVANTLKSRQSGQTQIATGTAQNTASLGTSVNTQRAFCMFQGWTEANGGTGNAAITFSTAKLTDASTVTLDRGASDGTVAPTVAWEVIEGTLKTGILINGGPILNGPTINRLVH